MTLINQESIIRTRKAIHIHKEWVFPIVGLLIIILFAAFQLHGSSVGMYHLMFYGDSQPDDDLLFGTVRPIRSDEWLVQTPWTASSAQNRFTQENRLYIGGQNFTFSDSPVLNWPAIFKPQYWIFAILPFKFAFAFKWWFRGFLLILASYLLLLRISGNKILISAVLAFSFLLSPFFQWWYSTSFIELVGFGLFILYFFWGMLSSQTTKSLIWNTIGFTYFALSYGLITYPAGQISVAWVIGLTILGLLFSIWKKQVITKIKPLAISLTTSLAIIAVVFGCYYFANREVFSIFTNTAYPGKVVASGGNLPQMMLFGGFYNMQLLDSYKLLPEILGNQSEAASFFFLGIFVYPFVLFELGLSIIRRKKPNLLMLGALLGFSLILLWGTRGLPQWLATILLFTHVSPRRALVALGVANAILTGVTLFRADPPRSRRYQIAIGVYSFFVFVFFVYYGHELTVDFPKFIQVQAKVVLIAAVAAVLVALLLLRKGLTFSILLLGFTLYCSYRVNPIYRGVDSLLNSDFSTAIHEIEDTNHREFGWVAYDSLILGNYIAANGGRVLNGTYLYPNNELWKNIDPDPAYTDIYNRYAHVLVVRGDESQPTYQLVHGDVFSVRIDPCSIILPDLGIKYLVFTQPASDACLSQVKVVDFPSMSIYIYERNN